MPTRRLASAAVLVTATLLTAADWPQWGGPNRNAVSPETGLLQQWPKEGPPLAWKVDIKGVGYSSPAVAGDRLYVTAASDPEKGLNEYAVCLNARDGSQAWKAALPNGSGGYSFGWGSGPRSTPTLDGDSLYVLGARGDLTCLSVKDGKIAWAVNLVKDFGGGIPMWGYSESVLIDGDKLVCTPGGSKGTILALDKKTGKKVWQSAELKDGAAYASIAAVEIGKTRQYVTQTSSAAVGVRASDGKPLWRVAELKRAVAVIPSPVVQDGYVFLTSGYGAGCELIKLEPEGDGTKATVVYTKNKAVSNHHGGLVRVGDYVYGHSDSGGRWVCFDFKKGGDDVAWEYKKFEKGTVIAADGRLYCFGEKSGRIVLVDPASGWAEKGSFEIPEKSKFPRRSGLIWTHPVIANGRLYLRDHEQLLCYNIAAK